MRLCLLTLLLLAAGGLGYSGGPSAQLQGPPGPPRPSRDGNRRGRPSAGSPAGVAEIFGWSQMDFAYPTPQARQKAIQSGAFDTSAVMPIGVAAAGNRVFLSMPRWRNGVPATLATVPFPASSGSPLLTPYPPDWAVHRQGNCEGITSVYRVKVDECNRLWVLDTGVVNSLVQRQQLCPPQLHVYDLATDRRVHRYRFPNTVIKPDSLLVTVEVEYPTRECGRDPRGATVYVADVTTFALIVADMRSSEAWRVQDKTMYPSPEAGTYTIAGESFELMDGILGLALTPPSTSPDRWLYFHALSSFRQRWVPISVLRNSTAASNSPRAFESSAWARPSQAAGCGMDQNGVLFFGLVAVNALGCWNTRKPFNRQHLGIIGQDDQAMQFIATTTVDPTGRLWAVSTRLQSFFAGTINPRDVNFRVFGAASTAEAILGTPCERGGHSGGGHFGGGPGGQENPYGEQNQLVFRP